MRSKRKSATAELRTRPHNIKKIQQLFNPVISSGFDMRPVDRPGDTPAPAAFERLQPFRINGSLNLPAGAYLGSKNDEAATLLIGGVWSVAP
jgi:hypothetical protein